MAEALCRGAVRGAEARAGFAAGGQQVRTPIIQLAPRRAEGQHPGLLLTRFLAEQNDKGDDKRALLKAAREAGRDQSLIELYRRAFDRWRKGLSGAEADLRTPAHTRLIVGLGAKGVI